MIETSHTDEKEADGVGEGAVQGLTKKKPRRVIPKLDADMLLRQNGIPHIRKNLSKLSFKGSGHELSDLKKLLRFFEYWAQDLCPRIPFSYFVRRVEKVCSSRRLKVHLSQWRGELSGILVGGSTVEDGMAMTTSTEIDPLDHAPMTAAQAWDKLFSEDNRNTYAEPEKEKSVTPMESNSHLQAHEKAPYVTNERVSISTSQKNIDFRSEENSDDERLLRRFEKMPDNV